MDHAALASLRATPNDDVSEGVNPLELAGYGLGGGLVVLLLAKFAGERSAASKRAQHRDAWIPVPISEEEMVRRRALKAMPLPPGIVKPEYVERLEAWKAKDPHAFIFDDSDAY